MAAKAESDPSIWNDDAANVRVAFVGTPETWDAMPWFNFSVAASWIQPECAIFGLSCQVTTIPNGDFCAVKVSDVITLQW